MKYIPREIPAFNEYCVATKSHLRCIKEWQDECGAQNHFVFFETPEIFQATYDTLSDICEDGTMLNRVVTENLKCFNETFGKIRCHADSDEFTEPFIRELEENEGSESLFSIFCLKSAIVNDCVLRTVSDNCGKLVGEAVLEAIRRSKTMENACTPTEAQSVLDKIKTLDLSEDKKKSINLLVEKIAGENK